MLSIQLLIFFIGLIVGSFLNVIIFRYDNNLSWKSLMGRCSCMFCKKKLFWYELIPLFSFLIQKRKCSGCGSKISWQYPAVEILTAFIFLLIFNFQFSIFNYFLNFEIFKYLNLLYLFVVFSILIVITVYDIKHKIIPNNLSFLFSGLALLPMLVNYQSIGVWHWLAGPLLALPFAFLWLVSQGRWMGFGDAKLVLGIGWFMGLVDGISSIILAFWIGSIFGLLLVLLSNLNSLSFINKNFTIKSEVPFAPFLILGMVLIFFFGWDLLSLKLVVSSW